MKLTKEAKVGLLALVSLAMLYFGFNYLKGSDFFDASRKYTVVYDNIDGLLPSNSVLINGLAVGRVKRIDILQEQGNKIMVTLDIERKIHIGPGTRAVLADGGLLGGKVIRLEVNPSGQPLEDGARLVAIKEAGVTSLIREKTLPVLNTVDSLTQNLNRIVLQFDRTGLVLNRTLKAAETATGTLDVTIAENRQNIRTLMGNLNRLSASLVETERQLGPILAKTSTFADSLNSLRLRQTLASANQSIEDLRQILVKVEQGQGTLGKLATSDALYYNVNNMTSSLDKLLVDFRENPKRYVHFSLFGRKDKDKKEITTAPTPGAETPRSDTNARAARPAVLEIDTTRTNE